MKVQRTRRNVFLLLTLATSMVLFLLLGATPVQGSPADRPPFARGPILVKFEPGTSPVERAAVHQLQGADRFA
jgi:hypothetical protein